MTDAQTEARAIQRYIAPSAGRGAVVQLLKHCDGEWVRHEDHIAALAAKDAELAAAEHMLELSKATTEAVLERAERAEAQLAEAKEELDVLRANQIAHVEVRARLTDQLAEAMKALDALDRMSRGVDWCDQDEQARRWSAARRALEARGGE